MSTVAATLKALVDWDQDQSYTVYPWTVIGLGPSGYWRCGEPAGSTLYDSSGNRNATQHGTVTYGVSGALFGDTDTAISLDGSTGYFTTFDTSLPSGNAARSIAFWAKPTTGDLSTTGSFFDVVWYGTASSNEAFAMGTNLGTWFFGPSGTIIRSTSTAPVAGNWYFVVWTWDGTTLKLYVNGTAQTLSATNPTINTVLSGTLAIGGTPGGAELYGGPLDEIAIFPTALTAANVTALWNAGNAGMGANPQDVTGNLRGQPTPKTFRGIDQVRPLETIRAGSIDFDLWNGPSSSGFGIEGFGEGGFGSANGLYSVGNTGSPLYGKLHAGPSVRLQATYSGTTYNLGTGYLDDLPQHPEVTQSGLSVSLPVLGSLSRLRVQGNSTQPMPISTALYQSITTGQAIGHILDAIGFPPFARALATGQTTLDWWWLDNADAFTALQELVNSEGPGARLYEDGSGNIVFEDRWYRWLQTRSTTSQITFNPTGSEPLYMPPFSWDASSKDVVNICTVTHTHRTLQATTKVWGGPSTTVSLPPNQAVSYIATASDPFINAVTPVQGTDFTLSYGSVASVTLDRTSGQRAKVTLTAGSNGAGISNLQLRAQPATVDSTTAITSTLDTSASQRQYHQRLYPLQVRQEINENVLQDFGNAVVYWFQNPPPHASITVLANGSDSRMTQCLTRQISDRVTIVENQTGINGPYWIESVQHEVGEAGFEMVTTLGLDAVVPNNAQPFILDVSKLDGADTLPAVLWF